MHVAVGWHSEPAAIPQTLRTNARFRLGTRLLLHFLRRNFTTSQFLTICRELRAPNPALCAYVYPTFRGRLIPRHGLLN